MGRQEHLALWKGDPTANVRMDCLSKKVMEDYFEKLKKNLKENNLMNSPAQIYNVDESGMPLDHRPPKVVALKGQKKVRSRTSGNKSQITVIACVSATGHALPPFVIFDAKGLNYKWTKGKITGTRYGLSSSGWVDTDLFKEWLVQHFLKHAVGGRPLLLILDGHSTHYQPEVIKYARSHKVILFCLPPHTTHESQPLDASVFKSLKLHWHEACHRFVEKNPGKSVTKYHFSKLLNEAWGKTMIPNVISSGFKRSGIYPFNPDAIDYGMNVDGAVPEEDKQVTEVEAEALTCSRELDFNENEALACSSEQQFTPEQEELFKRRYEEEYDIPDPLYLQWVKINHPEKHPDNTSLLDHFSVLTLDSVDPATEDSLCLVNSTAVVPCAVAPLSREVTPENEDELVRLSNLQVEAPEIESHPGPSSEEISESDSASATKSVCPGLSCVPSAAENIPPPEHESELNYISKYLV